MKANELMIDDWVYNKNIDKPMQVYPMMISQMFRRTPDATTEDYNIFPIPITKEILEKNGFEDYDSYATLDTKKYRVIYAFDGFLTIVDDDNQRKVSYLECDYVHHLQHTLRLCGIEKEIEL